MAEAIPWYLILVAAAAVFAGATASIVGFGIGSILTPLLAVELGVETAIAVVALPHFAATLLRAWRMRRSVDRSVLVRFGLWSTVGGLMGALFYARLGGTVLSVVLGLLLVLTAIADLARWSERWRPSGPAVWLLGLASGIFGGVAGNQGGLRAAALNNFGLSPTAFVATSTAIGVLIDIARTPVYVIRAGHELWSHAGLIGLLITGAVIGTLAGERILLGIPARHFRVVVATAIGLLGIALLLGAW